MTCAAPDRSRTSVKPPVDAPASRHRRPATRSAGKAASAPASFAPPRDAYCGSCPAPVTRIGSPAATWVAGLPAAWPATSTRPSATRPAACSRDRASPLLTSSASSRRRVPIRCPGRRSAAQRARAVVRYRPLTRAAVAHGVREPLVNALEDRWMLGDGQSGHVLQLGDRLVHPAVARGRPRAARPGRAPVTVANGSDPQATVTFTTKSDELLALAENPASIGRAWLTGRLKVEASIFDLLCLRKVLCPPRFPAGQHRAEPCPRATPSG